MMSMSKRAGFTESSARALAEVTMISSEMAVSMDVLGVALRTLDPAIRQHTAAAWLSWWATRVVSWLPEVVRTLSSCEPLSPLSEMVVGGVGSGEIGPEGLVDYLELLAIGRPVSRPGVEMVAAVRAFAARVDSLAGHE
jgi:hypothetical protein